MSGFLGREHGSKPGSAGPAPAELQAIARKNRLANIVSEAMDLKNDPYLMKNHIGKFECKLCLTLHPSESNYLAHTQGKRHQEQLAKRQAKLAKESKTAGVALVEKKKIQPRRTVKIGRPGYKVVKQRDPVTNQRSLLFVIHYPKVEEGLRPRFRFMSAYEQHVEVPNDKFQYLLFACEPYEVIAFKIPNKEIDKAHDKFLTHWDEAKLDFILQLHFRAESGGGEASTGAGAGAGGGGGGSNGRDVHQQDAWGDY